MPTSYERISDSWRMDTLRVALAFLALDESAKAAYLPDNFPTVTFHMADSDMDCGNPLAFMAAYCDDACRIEHDSADVTESLLRIIGVLSVLDYDERQPVWRAREIWLGGGGWSSPTLHVWAAVRFLARDALRRLGWPAEPPSVSCLALLREFSYDVFPASNDNV